MTSQTRHVTLQQPGVSVPQQPGIEWPLQHSLTLPLEEAIPVLSVDHGLCVTMVGPWMGRLSNHVSMLNTVLRLALLGGASFRFPDAYGKTGSKEVPMRKKHLYNWEHPFDWMKLNGFSEMFGKEPVCPRRNVSTLALTCAVRNRRGRCDVRDMLVSMDVQSWPWEASTLCDCRRILVVNCTDMEWDLDYRHTHNFLRVRYWKAHVDPPPLDVLLLQNRENNSGTVNGSAARSFVTVHMRLGDIEIEGCVEKWGSAICKKRLSPDTYLMTLGALFQVLPPNCSSVNIITDGTPESPDVQKVAWSLKDAGVQVEIWAAKRLDVHRSFDFMALSDVLVYGVSGFSQIAALFSRPEAARVGLPQPLPFKADPLSFRPNTTQVYEDDTVRTSAQRISQNAAVLALRERCMGPSH